MRQVLVIGDVLQDTYWPISHAGEANEGREGHCPVYRAAGTPMRVYGGVVNVGKRIAKGKDVEAHVLSGTDMEGAGNCLHHSAVMPIKDRYCVGNKVLFRVDCEGRPRRSHPSPIAYDREAFLESHDALVVIDYGKMLNWCSYVQPVITQQKKANPKLLVLVDPKLPDWVNLVGVDYATPNKEELRKVRPNLLAGFLLSGGQVLETRGTEGVWHHYSSKECRGVDEYPALNVTPEDVCGAGEAFISQLCLSLLNKTTLSLAVAQAQMAAAECVSHLGCVSLVENDAIGEMDLHRRSG